MYHVPPWRVPGPSALPRPRPGGAKAPRDAQLVSEIYREHADALRRFALRGYCSREEADDVVQETVLKVWKAAPEITGSLRGYLFATARHVIIDEHRRAAARIHADLLGDADPAAAGAEDGNVQVLDRLLMQQALMRLSAEHRLVVLHLHFFGSTVAQAAHDLHIPEGTVKSREHYALRNLRGILAEMGEEP
ncbi:sigma-70 family RNA polymerase sigma factor [Glutamicibacter halophytocola]|nr:sigma-70 family RNA polymerase sigma factor [Glutamicibacter halophytocola]